RGAPAGNEERTRTDWQHCLLLSGRANDRNIVHPRSDNGVSADAPEPWPEPGIGCAAPTRTRVTRGMRIRSGGRMNGFWRCCAASAFVVFLGRVGAAARADP